MFRTFALALAALALIACGETSEQKVAREKFEQQQAVEKAEQEQREAKQAGYEKYLADCKVKNGTNHWGPFTYYNHYARGNYVANNRYRSRKFYIASRTNKVWQEAERRQTCVVAESDGYGVLVYILGERTNGKYIHF